MVKQYLVVGPAWVGDMVMAQSLFQVLKRQNPDCVIDVLAPDWTRPLLERMVEVRTPVSFAVRSGELKLGYRYQVARALRQHAYDQAIILPHSWKSALVPFLAHIPVRTGYRGECRWGLLNDLRILDKVRLPQMVERFVALAYPPDAIPTPLDCPSPCLEISTAGLMAAKLRLDLTVSKRPILVMCPGAEFGPAKRWPEGYFAEIAKAQLAAGWSVWILGSKNDMPVAREIQHLTEGQCVDLTGRTTLGEAIDLLSLAQVVLTNDSGLMHIAAALQKEVIALFGPTDPKHTPPLGAAHLLHVLTHPTACSPCFKRECPLLHHQCLRGLKPEQVLSVLADKTLRLRRG